jgi:hypothetical protein
MMSVDPVLENPVVRWADAFVTQLFSITPMLRERARADGKGTGFHPSLQTVQDFAASMTRLHRLLVDCKRTEEELPVAVLVEKFPRFVEVFEEVEPKLAIALQAIAPELASWKLTDVRYRYNGLVRSVARVTPTHLTLEHHFQAMLKVKVRPVTLNGMDQKPYRALARLRKEYFKTSSPEPLAEYLAFAETVLRGENELRVSGAARFPTTPTVEDFEKLEAYTVELEALSLLASLEEYKPAAKGTVEHVSG